MLLPLFSPGRSLIYSLFNFHFSYELFYLLRVKYNMLIILSMSLQIGVHHLIVFVFDILIVFLKILHLKYLQKEHIETNQFILSRVP